MTTMASAKAALLTQLQAESGLSTVQVAYGDSGSATRRESIFLGDVSSNDVSPESITSGRQRQLEDYQIQVFVCVQSKPVSAQAAETRAATLATVVTNSIADTPQLGGSVSGLMFAETAAMSMQTTEAGIDGPQVVIEISVRILARLS